MPDRAPLTMLLRVQPQAFSPKPAKPCLWCPNIVLLWLLGVLQQPCDVRSRLSGDWPVPPECASALRVIPKYAQLLRLEACQVNKGSRSDPAREIEVIQPLEVEVIQPLEVEVIQPLVVHRLPSEPSCWYEAAWGIPFSPSEFLECAVAAGHPAMLEGHLPKELQDQQKCLPRNLHHTGSKFSKHGPRGHVTLPRMRKLLRTPCTRRSEKF